MDALYGYALELYEFYNYHHARGGKLALLLFNKDFKIKLPN